METIIEIDFFVIWVFLNEHFAPVIMEENITDAKDQQYASKHRYSNSRELEKQNKTLSTCLSTGEPICPLLKDNGHFVWK